MKVRVLLLGITMAMPLMTVLLAAWLTNMFFAVDSYNWWYIGLYPGFLGVMCSIIGGKDKGKKNYTIWSLPCKFIVRIWRLYSRKQSIASVNFWP